MNKSAVPIEVKRNGGGQCRKLPGREPSKFISLGLRNPTHLTTNTTTRMDLDDTTSASQPNISREKVIRYYILWNNG
jgi:hypothetical protein